ncbi:MAG TPA: hypothetical protein VG944_06145, partial [Fimbriimonas sp.]|nr:hypothetical protein [Fimbriimonas sp.]
KAGPWERSRSVIENALGVQFQRTPDGYKMVTDPAVAKIEAKLLTTEAKYCFEPIQALSASAWNLLQQHATESRDQLLAELHEEIKHYDSDEQENPTNGIGVLNRIVQSPVLVPAMEWSVSAPSFEALVREGIGQLLIPSDSSSDDLARRYGALSINPRNLFTAIAKKTDGRFDELSKSGMILIRYDFDPVTERAVTRFQIRFGAQSDFAISASGMAIHEISPPSLKQLHAEAGDAADYGRRLKTSDDLLASPTATKSLKIPVAASFSRGMAGWADAAGLEIVAPLSPVRSTAISSVSSVSLKQMTDGMTDRKPAFEGSSTYTLSFGSTLAASERGPDWTADTTSDVVVLRNERAFLDNLRWPDTPNTELEDAILGKTERTLDDWERLADSTKTVDLEALARADVFEEDTGFLSSYPVLRAISRLPAVTKEKIRQMQVGTPIEVSLGEAAHQTTEFLTAATQLAQPLCQESAGMRRELWPILQLDAEAALQQGKLILSWTKSADGTYKLKSEVKVPIDPLKAANRFVELPFKAGLPEVSLWQACLYGVVKP